MSDGSSVRTKVAQYFINQQLQELESINPRIKVDEDDCLQALPSFRSSTDGSSVAQSQLFTPPIGTFPISAPGDGHVSWKHLRDFPDRDSRRNDPWDKKDDLPPWYCVAIIGAGVAGLRAAKLLQDCGIPYRIFEASDRPGGRIFTYQFPSKPPKDPQGKHDYYDVGAMRFPANSANRITFDLFNELKLSRKMIPYVFSRKNAIMYFNGIKSTAAVASTAGNHFKDETVPEEYYNKEHVDLRGETVYGVDACIGAAYDPFRKALLDNFRNGWKELMKYDWASTRSYLTREKPGYPIPVVQWLETRQDGTGGFDHAFSESILESLEFNDPSEPEWWCLEGGTRVLIDAMLTQVDQPEYNRRVTSIKALRPDEGPIYSPKFPLMQVSTAGRPDEWFTHVISTTTFANLNTIDTTGVPMTYKQRQAIRSLLYGTAVKVAIKFKSRWWEKSGIDQRGASSYTDRQSRVVVYPSAGIGEEGPGVLMVSYNWHQDASRFGALIENPDWSKQLDPDRARPPSEQILLDQIYEDLAVLHGVSAAQLRQDTLDYHAYDWYHNPYTMGGFAYFGPGQFSTLFPDIVMPAARGRFHFAGEVASAHHAWVGGALDSAVRAVSEILWWDFPNRLPTFANQHGYSSVFSDEEKAKQHFVRGLFAQELEKAEMQQK